MLLEKLTHGFWMIFGETITKISITKVEIPETVKISWFAHLE
jgi:hypothetical protein